MFFFILSLSFILFLTSVTPTPLASRFLGLVGSLSLEQKLWLPNQVVHDPDTRDVDRSPLTPFKKGI